MTEGDRILIRAINAALVAQPFIDPLPITLGGGHRDPIARRGALAGNAPGADGARSTRGPAAPCGDGAGVMSAKDEDRMNAIAEAVANGATLPAAFRRAGVSGIAGRGLWARICARLGVPVAGEGK